MPRSAGVHIGGYLRRPNIRYGGSFFRHPRKSTYVRRTDSLFHYPVYSRKHRSALDWMSTKKLSGLLCSLGRTQSKFLDFPSLYQIKLLKKGFVGFFSNTEPSATVIRFRTLATRFSVQALGTLVSITKTRPLKRCRKRACAAAATLNAESSHYDHWKRMCAKIPYGTQKSVMPAMQPLPQLVDSITA